MEDERRRRQERHPISIDVKLDTPNISIQIVAVNISENGLGLQSLRNIQPSSRANISMTSPVEATFYGTLTWSQHTLIKNLDAYALGFETDAILYEGTVADTAQGKEQIVQKILQAVKA
jgi:hypothetical protein